MLIGTFFAYPSFQQRFGERLPNGTYSLTAQWQTALGEPLSLTSTPEACLHTMQVSHQRSALLSVF